MSGSIFHGVQVKATPTFNKPFMTPDANVIAVIGTGQFGEQEPEDFPLNTPVLVCSKDMLSAMGAGTLRDGFKALWAENPDITAVAVRVANTETASFIGDMGEGTGVHAFAHSMAKAGVHPRIFIAPNVQDADVAKALEVTAEELGGIAIVEANGEGLADWKAFTGTLGDSYVVAGGAKFFNSDIGTDDKSGGSATAAGILSRAIASDGYWHSPSNRPAKGIKTAQADIPHIAGSKSCMSNLISQNNMACFINIAGGAHLWGNRLASGKFIQHVLAERIIKSAVRTGVAIFQDKNITVGLLDAIKARMDSFGAALIAKEIIYHFDVSIPKALNQTAVGTGELYVHFEFSQYDCAENIQVSYAIENDRLKEIFK